MRITFVLPGFITVPMGGVKTVIEYANQLSRRGHSVTLVYPIRKTILIKHYLQKIFSPHFGNSEQLYYHPAPEVNVLVVRNLNGKYLPMGDVIVACGWQTAHAVAQAPEYCGKKFYLLQSFETYFRAKKKVLDTYHLPLTKIAISQWVINELQKIGETALGPLNNAINKAEFFQIGRLPRDYDLIYFYHHRHIKGPDIALKVLKKLHKIMPTLKVLVIAPRKPIHPIPKWCNVSIRPSIEELRTYYNRTKILLFTSRWEGWGLPPMEALACGCAVVSVANKGVKEYLEHEVSALLYEPSQIDALTQAIIQLLNEESTRQRLVENGKKVIAKYDWNDIITKLEKFFNV